MNVDGTLFEPIEAYVARAIQEAEAQLNTDLSAMTVSEKWRFYARLKERIFFDSQSTPLYFSRINELTRQLGL